MSRRGIELVESARNQDLFDPRGIAVDREGNPLVLKRQIRHPPTALEGLMPHRRQSHVNRPVMLARRPRRLEELDGVGDGWGVVLSQQIQVDRHKGFILAALA